MNKTVLLALVVLCIVVMACAPAPAPAPTAAPPTVVPAPTVAPPTSVPKPTDAPKPTEPPKPTDMPKPTTAPTAAPTTPPQPVKLSVLYYYTTDAGKVVIESMLTDFQKANPTFTLDIQVTTLAKLPEVLQTRAAANDLPDVALVASQRIPPFAAAGKLTDGTPYLPKDYKDQFEMSRFVEVYFDGKIYGVPVGTTVRAVAYNVDYFEKAGVKAPTKPEEAWTWDDLVKIANTLKEKTGVKYPLQFERPSLDGWVPFLFQNKGALVSADFKKAVINEPAGVEAIQWTVDLHKQKLAAPGVLEGTEDFIALFASGTTAISLGTGNNQIPTFEAQMKNFKYSFTFMPKGKLGSPATVASGGDWVVFDTKKPKEAWKLVEFLGSEEMTARWANELSAVPARKTVKGLGWKMRPDLMPFFVEQAKYMPDQMAKEQLHPFYGATRDKVLQELAAAVSGQKTAQQAADAMAQFINAELKK